MITIESVLKKAIFDKLCCSWTWVFQREFKQHRFRNSWLCLLWTPSKIWAGRITATVFIINGTHDIYHCYYPYYYYYYYYCYYYNHLLRVYGIFWIHQFVTIYLKWVKTINNVCQPPFLTASGSLIRYVNLSVWLFRVSASFPYLLSIHIEFNCFYGNLF